MPLSPPQSSRTGHRARAHPAAPRRSRRRGAVGMVAALVLAAAGTTAAAGPAHATGPAHAAGPAHATTPNRTATHSTTAADCLTVRASGTSWHTGPDRGGVQRDYTITNTCDTAVTGWTLVLALAPGHTFQQGWNATWTGTGTGTGTGGTWTARPAAWNSTVAAGGSISTGYLGTWTGSPQEPGCTFNGTPCGVTPTAKVALTSPTDGSVLVSVCAVRLTAEAQAQVGTIARVEFHINGQLVGSDTTAPYAIDVPPSHPALLGGTRHTAFARVVTLSPAATADSQTATFSHVPPPPALMVVACPSQVKVPAGGSTTVTFVTVCSDTPGLHLAVIGDPGITITPTVSPPGSREHQITVSAAPGSAGATARITANVDTGSCLPASATVTVS